MFLYTGVMTIGFGGMDFSTGETSMSGDGIAGCAFVLGAIGAIVGGMVGLRIAKSPGKRGKRIGFWLGLFIPLQSIFFVLVYAAIVSVAVAIVSIFSPGVLSYQRGIILLGVWVVSILVLVFTVTDNGQESAGLGGGGHGGRHVRASDDEVSSTAIGSVSSGIVYRTTPNLFGGTTTRGSDGTVYRTTESLFGGGTTTRGSDGTVYRTTENLFGDGTTTRSQ